MESRLLLFLLILFYRTSTKFAPMKDIPKNKFDPSLNSFWSSAEIEHLQDDSLNLFSCFVEKLGECNYFQQSFPNSPEGCLVDGSTGVVTFTSPRQRVLVTGSDALSFDLSTLPNAVLGTTELYIVNAQNLVTIPPEIFQRFPNLEEIVIFNVGITSLTVSSPLPKMQRMAILKTGMTRIIGNSLSQMPDLERLNLACNNISYVADYAFNGLEKLLRLTLGYNSLKYLPQAISAIKGTVQYLGLEENSIEKLPSLPFKGMEALAHINLTNNDITEIEPMWMDECISLRFLELNGNSLKELDPFSINGGKLLSYVTVSRNDQLEFIHGNAFKDLDALKVLDMVGNEKLHSIDYRAFKNINSVKYIDMSENALTTFPHSVFIYANFTNVKRLFMQNNEITTLSELTTEALNNITSILEFKFKDVYPFSVSFNQMVNLRTINLSHNKLTVIPNGVFDCFKDKEGDLDLSNNKLVTVEDDAFTEMKFDALSLNSNYFLEVPKALFKVKALNVLNMDTNLLTYLKRGTLQNLNMTEKLFLQNNQILAVEDDALPRSLVVIDLSRNEFDFVDENQFNNMPNLQFIDFRENRISYLPISAFENNPNLKTIYLSDNSINWIDNGTFSTVSEQIDDFKLEKNNLAFVEAGTFASKIVKEMYMNENDLHDWPQDGSFSNQTEQFYAEFSNNKFEVIRTGMFKDHSKFRNADFQSNHISDVEEYAFHNLKVDYKKGDGVLGVKLTDNPVSNLEPFSFTNIKSENSGKGKNDHTGLDLQQIRTLFTLRSDTFTDIKLDYIFLNNGEVKLIETHSFNRIHLYWTLQFNDGPLKYVAKKAVNAYWIRYIQFNRNKIKKLPLGAFEEISECENFNIDNNEINFIDTDSLPNCSDKFNFQSNEITHVVVDAFRKATSVTNLQLTDNALIKIEDRAMDTFSSKLNKLYLGNNPLPQIPDKLLEGSNIAILGMGGNNLLQTIGQQGLQGLAKQALTIKDNQDAYVDASLYQNVKRKDKGIFLYGVSRCTCNLMRAIAYINAKQATMAVKRPTSCSYTNVLNGQTATLTINSNSPTNARNKLQCEAYATRLVRTSRTFSDQLPIAETLTIYWRFPQYSVWETNKHYCCAENEASGCVSQAVILLTCEIQPIEGDPEDLPLDGPKFTVQLSSSDACDKEFSHSVNINTSPSDFIICGVQIEIPGRSGEFSSIGARRVGYQEELRTTAKIPSDQQTITFQATYFDLTNDFADFQNMGYDVIYKKPKMYDSPNIGPYLYMTNQFSEEDTITQWFTPNSHVTGILQEEFALKSCPDLDDGDVDEGSHCMLARQWWPVDSLVDTLLDTTANFKRHNMYFTARLRLPITLTGNEILSIGGPDDIWVFMNGTLVLEVLAEEDDSAPLPCGRISFDTARSKFIRSSSIINTLRDETQVSRCSVNDDAEQVVVPDGEFTVGNSMYLDIFTTQRRSLSSLLFLHLTGFKETDYSDFTAFSMSERKIRDGKIDTLDLTTVLGDQTYTIDIIDATAQNDFFEVQNDVFVWKPDPAPPTVNQNPGNGVPAFYNCSEPSETTPFVTPTHSTSVTTPTALVTLKNPLDYEAMGENKFRYLYLNVRYGFAEIEGGELQTKLRIRVNVEDANDNCPAFEDDENALIDRTKLCLDPRGTPLNVSDADHAENKAIQYFIGENCC